MEKIILFMLILVLSLAAAAAVDYMDHDMSPSGPCKGDFNGLTKNCAPYVQKPGPIVPPSATCCKAIQGSDVPCICKNYITGEIAKLVDVKKLVYVADKCGRPFAHGSKCGNFTIPA